MEGEMSDRFSELFRALGVGATIGLALGVLAYYVGEFFPETRPFTLMVTVSMAIVVAYCDLILQRVRQPKVSLSGRRIARALAKKSDTWTRQLAEAIAEDTAEELETLTQPSEQYYGETPLYRALTSRVLETKAGESVFAVCGDKTWDDPFVQEYLDVNKTQAKKGVLIKRVFFEFSGRVMAAAAEQANAGISTWVLRATRMVSIRPPIRIAQDFGLAVFSERTVILHSGTGANARGTRYESARLARQIRDRFAVVERLAEEVVRQPHLSNSGDTQPKTRR
jgi:hypothetical protein